MAEQYKPTHRMEFGMMSLLSNMPVAYVIGSLRQDDDGHTRCIDAQMQITLPSGERLDYMVTPWLHEDALKVSLFYRRQDATETAHVARLKRILEDNCIPYTLCALRR